MRQGFIIYHGEYDQLDALSDAQFRALMNALRRYSEAGEVPALAGAARMAFRFMARSIDGDEARYQARCESGKKAVRARWDRVREHADECERMPPDDLDAEDANPNPNPNPNPNANPNPNEREMGRDGGCGGARDVRDARTMTAQSAAHSGAAALRSEGRAATEIIQDFRTGTAQSAPQSETLSPRSRERAAEEVPRERDLRTRTARSAPQSETLSSRSEERATEEDATAPPRKDKPARFEKPTAEAVARYCAERGSRVDPVKFHDHYEANGWMIGKAPMRDWRAAVRLWERSEYGNGRANDVDRRSHPEQSGDRGDHGKPRARIPGEVRI